MKESDEKRDGRFNIYFDIAILRRDETPLNDPIRGISVNVSRGEALCLVRGRLARGERITIEISQKKFIYPPSGNGKVICRGQVIKVKKADEGLTRAGGIREIGVRIEEGLDNVERLIDEYLAWERSPCTSGADAFTRAGRKFF